jgi:hypothetical protein
MTEAQGPQAHEQGAAAQAGATIDFRRQALCDPARSVPAPLIPDPDVRASASPAAMAA